METQVVIHRVQIGLFGLLALAIVCGTLRDIAITVAASK